MHATQRFVSLSGGFALTGGVGPGPTWDMFANLKFLSPDRMSSVKNDKILTEIFRFGLTKLERYVFWKKNELNRSPGFVFLGNDQILKICCMSGLEMAYGVIP